MTFGLGWLPDLDVDVDFDLRFKHVGALIGASAFGVPAEINYAWRLDSVQHQGTTSSCVGQALASSLYLRASIYGAPIRRPSALAIYTFARLVANPHTLLEDVGSRPRAAMVGLQDYGIVADERWPLTSENLNTHPPLDVYVNAGDAVLTDYYRIASGSGDGASILVRQALARGFCPVFATDIDQDFQRYAGGVWRGRTGPSLGGHMMCAVGYDADGIIVLNSWGTGWGVGGYAKVADQFFDEGRARDVLVPTVTPAVIT